MVEHSSPQQTEEEYVAAVRERNPGIADVMTAALNHQTRAELQGEIATLRLQLAEARVALERIDDWCTAYPLSVFPEPDLKKAAELLKAGGITLDAVSASNMRHVLKGVSSLVTAALATGREG